MSHVLSYVVFEAANLASSSLYSSIFGHLFPARLPGLAGYSEIGVWLETGSSLEGGCESFAVAVGFGRGSGWTVGRLWALGDGRHGGSVGVGVGAQGGVKALVVRLGIVDALGPGPGPGW